MLRSRVIFRRRISAICGSFQRNRSEKRSCLWLPSQKTYTHTHTHTQEENAIVPSYPRKYIRVFRLFFSVHHICSICLYAFTRLSEIKQDQPRTLRCEPRFPTDCVAGMKARKRDLSEVTSALNSFRCRSNPTNTTGCDSILPPPPPHPRLQITLPARGVLALSRFEMLLAAPPRNFPPPSQRAEELYSLE